MGTYSSKFKRGDNVWVLGNKKIFQTYIEEVRIVDNGCVNINENGITITYMVETNKKGNIKEYDVFDEENIFLSKDELIASII